MAAPNDNILSATNRNKLNLEKDDNVFEVEHLKPPRAQVDYSGAHAKTDPREIALVKKLDWYIMPILWLMYWLNYLVRISAFNSPITSFKRTDSSLSLRIAMQLPLPVWIPLKKILSFHLHNTRPVYRSCLWDMSLLEYPPTWLLPESDLAYGWHLVWPSGRLLVDWPHCQQTLSVCCLLVFFSALQKLRITQGHYTFWPHFIHVKSWRFASQFCILETFLPQHSLVWLLLVFLRCMGW